ncbi:MAG: hypothetical protein KF897_16565 [Opitutaceae bacterium]|nr:hypothetical protein [Opitutaceae bacterium]
MRRLVLLSLLAFVAPLAALAQEGRMPLFGKVKNKVYTAPSGAYRITSPVLSELGGTISDSEYVVVFQDQFTIHITIACFKQDATQRWEYSTRGPKEYFRYFFASYVFPDLQQSYPEITVTDESFDPKYLDGAWFINTHLPGGTMFMHRLAEPAPGAPPPVAKRGNLLFVKYGHVYVVSTELAERLTEGHTYKLNLEQENQLIRERLEGIVNLMDFVRPSEDGPR